MNQILTTIITIIVLLLRVFRGVIIPNKYSI